jgi:hypothetical protein
MRRTILLLVLVMTGAACGSDEADTQASIEPTTTTTAALPPASSTTAQPVTPTTGPPIGDWFSFGDPISIDARHVVGALSAPEGWQAWVDDSGTLLLSEEGAACGEEGETCAAAWVAIDSYVASEVPGLAGYLEAAERAGMAADDRLTAALRDLIDAYYAWIAAQDWGWYQFEPIDPTPAPVGMLTGIHFGYRGVRGEESIQHTDAYMTYDGTYLYVVMVRMPELIPTPEPVDFVALFAPSLATIVADLRLPVQQEALIPQLASDWLLQPDDILVSRHDGIVVVRGDPGTIVQVISTEPNSQAHHDRMDGIVFQQATARTSWNVHPSEMAIWWVPEPGAEPVVLHEPDPGKPASLFGVAEIDGIPHALYLVVDSGGPMPRYVLVAHDLFTGEPHRVGPIGGGEVWPHCVSWAIDRFLVSVTAEENTFFEFVSSDGATLEPEAPVPPALESASDTGTWYASTCAALRESDGMAAVVLRTFEGPNHLVIVDVANGTQVQTIEIDADVLAAGAEAEMWPGDIGYWETRIDFVGEVVLISDLGYGVSGPFVVDLTTGEITMLPVEGMATLVR